MACLADGVDDLDRVCGSSGDCPIAITGRCTDLCDDSGCKDAAGNLYPESIAVYRDRL